MADDSDQEKTEQPTGKRIQDARDDGQTPQSRELSTFLILIGGVIGLWSLGGWIGSRLLAVLQRQFDFERIVAYDHRRMLMGLHEALGDTVLTMLPLYLILMVAAITGPLLLGGLNFSPKALALKLERLNPISGFGRMFSVNGLAELVKSLLKVSLLGGIGAWVFMRHHEQWLGLVSMPLDRAALAFFDTLLWSALFLVLGLAILAAIDVPFQLWQYYRKLRMTKEEVKKEHKETDGDPQVKARIRSVQREMARKRMMSNVAEADVVVTNPTHFSVALRYDAQKMNAPIVVAKGRGELALKIREVAAENSVPLLEAPPLARALYAHCELDQSVPAPLYTAVAEVLAYVYQLNEWLEKGGKRPGIPQALPVPRDLDPEAQAEPA